MSWKPTTTNTIVSQVTLLTFENAVEDGSTFSECVSSTHGQFTDYLQTEETLSLLTRLSQKPGVQSTLILSRDTGAIVRTSGLISNSSSANPNSTLPASGETTADNYVNGRKESGIHSAEDVASAVWRFLGAAGSLVDELDKEDDVRLLRLRTKKNELVIVPGMFNMRELRVFTNQDSDPKFILVLIHDTPPA
jgi:hypothetical protein